MMQIRTVMVTTDFSDTSVVAFGPARVIAEKFGARILLAHVEEDRLPPLIGEYTVVGLEEILERQKELAREQVSEFARKHLGEGVETELTVIEGTPHVEIVRLAEERGVDLIVMATHGRGFMSHAIMGSTTERVLRRAPCPVLVIRDPSAQ